jgi:hypothetical protein
MRDPRAHEALLFDVKFIVKRIVSWPRHRRGMDDPTTSRIAREIVTYLHLSNWRPSCSIDPDAGLVAPF